MLQIFSNIHFFDLIAPVFSFFKFCVKDITYSKTCGSLLVCFSLRLHVHTAMIFVLV